MAPSCKSKIKVEKLDFVKVKSVVSQSRVVKVKAEPLTRLNLENIDDLLDFDPTHSPSSESSFDHHAPAWSGDDDL